MYLHDKYGTYQNGAMTCPKKVPNATPIIPQCCIKIKESPFWKKVKNVVLFSACEFPTSYPLLY